MQLPLHIDLIKEAFPSIGQTVRPKPLCKTLYTERHQWEKAMIYSVDNLITEGCILCRLKGACPDGKMFDFAEFHDNIEEVT